MKKSLIALAALAVSGAAFAQSSVTLYGIADVWVGKYKEEMLDDGSIVKGKAKVGSGGVSTSRLGFKGTEDLGGGLKAHFNFEQKLDLTNGGTNAKTFNRQANVGFSGGFGTVKLGRSFNAMDDVFGAANSGFDSALSANAVWLNGITGAADAQLYYATPEFAGFTAAMSTQLNGNKGTADGNGRISSFNVAYANGPIGAAVGYEDDESGQEGLMVNGSYDLGVAKLLGSYFTTKPEVGARTNSYQIGADVPLSSALTLSVGYANSKVKGGEADTGFGVAAAYSLSKRTSVYGGVRAESRKSGAADGDFFAVGVRHAF